MAYSGGGYYYGRGGYYYGSTWYRYPRLTHVTLAFGLPFCYCPPAYRTVVVSRPVVVEEVYEVDVDNLPPAGCYYYDPFCDREYPDLDTYTEHIDGEGHAGTIEIRYLDSGDYVRTLEFVGGYWIVQR